MRLTKDDIEGRKQSIKICREDGHNGFFIPFPELEEMLDQLLQREQDVADLVALVQQVKPQYFQSDDGHKTCSSCGATDESHFDSCWNTRAQALLARIREQDGK